MRVTHRALVAVTFSAFGACTSGTDSGESTEFAGRYVLGTVNGQVLPAVIPRDPAVATWQRFVESGELVTNADRTFTDRRTLQIRTTGTPFQHEQVWTGRWRLLEGARIELRYDDSHAGKVDTAEVLGELLSHREPGAMYLYSR